MLTTRFTPMTRRRRPTMLARTLSTALVSGLLVIEILLIIGLEQIFGR